MRNTLAIAALLSASLSTAAFAQDATGSIHGHVQSPIAAPVTDATVHVSSDGKDTKYSFPTDANGDFKGTGIAPGTYFLNLYEGDKPIDQLTEIKIVAGQDEQEDFDMTREAYMSKLTPEQRKQIEDVKAKNAAVMQGNAVIKNLNGDLATARADIKNKNFADADALMTKDTQAKPDAAVLWLELANAQNGEKKYPDATTSYQKVITLESAAPKPNVDLLGSAGNGLGEALAAQNKTPDAAAAYDAADKAIAADPNKPIPYYLKGQALMNKATVGKDGKIVAPPDCVDAYQKYLELAPDGPMAPEVKQVLTEMGQTIKTSYKAGKSH